MATAGWNLPKDPMERFARQLRSMDESIRALQTKQFSIPVLAANPPETEPINLWMFANGRLRGRALNSGGTAFVYYDYALLSDIPTAPPAPAPPAPAPPKPAPKTRVSYYTAQWTQGYRDNGTKRTDHPTYMHYGYVDSFNGRNQSLIGFDHGDIASDLSGSTIEKVELNMTNIHSWYNSGSYIHFGIHNFSSEPSTWSGGGIPRRFVTKKHYGKPENKWVTLSIDFAKAIRDGWGKGIALESPNNSREYYGYAAGVGSGYATPKLKITYVK